MAGGSGWQVAVEAGGFLHQGRSALAKNFAKTNPSQSNGCQLAGILQAKMRTKASLNQAGGCDHLTQPPSLEVSSKALLNDNGLLLLDNMHCVLQHPRLRSGLRQCCIPRNSLWFEGFEKSETSSSKAPSNTGTLQRIWTAGQNACHTK